MIHSAGLNPSRYNDGWIVHFAAIYSAKEFRQYWACDTAPGRRCLTARCNTRDQRPNGRFERVASSFSSTIPARKLAITLDPTCSRLGAVARIDKPIKYTAKQVDFFRPVNVVLIRRPQDRHFRFSLVLCLSKASGPLWAPREWGEGAGPVCWRIEHGACSTAPFLRIQPTRRHGIIACPPSCGCILGLVPGRTVAA